MVAFASASQLLEQFEERTRWSRVIGYSHYTLGSAEARRDHRKRRPAPYKRNHAPNKFSERLQQIPSTLTAEPLRLDKRLLLAVASRFYGNTGVAVPLQLIDQLLSEDLYLYALLAVWGTSDTPSREAMHEEIEQFLLGDLRLNGFDEKNEFLSQLVETNSAYHDPQLAIQLQQLPYQQSDIVLEVPSEHVQQLQKLLREEYLLQLTELEAKQLLEKSPAVQIELRAYQDELHEVVADALAEELLGSRPHTFNSAAVQKMSEEASRRGWLLAESIPW